MRRLTSIENKFGHKLWEWAKRNALNMNDASLIINAVLLANECTWAILSNFAQIESPHFTSEYIQIPTCCAICFPFDWHFNGKVVCNMWQRVMGRGKVMASVTAPIESPHGIPIPLKTKLCSICHRLAIVSMSKLWHPNSFDPRYVGGRSSDTTSPSQSTS